jgi:hypothetical protein
MIIYRIDNAAIKRAIKRKNILQYRFIQLFNDSILGMPSEIKNDITGFVYNRIRTNITKIIKFNIFKGYLIEGRITDSLSNLNMLDMFCIYLGIDMKDTILELTKYPLLDVSDTDDFVKVDKNKIREYISIRHKVDSYITSDFMAYALDGYEKVMSYSGKEYASINFIHNVAMLLNIDNYEELIIKEECNESLEDFIKYNNKYVNYPEIKRLMKYYNITQKEMNIRLGRASNSQSISRFFYSKLIGTRYQYDMLCKIAIILEVPVEQLITDKKIIQ